MRIVFVTECDYSPAMAFTGAELVLFPFLEGAVSYESEIKGTTDRFKRLGALSAGAKAVLVAGMDTDSYGSLRHSAAVLDGGKLLGISDMTIVRGGERYIGGGNLRVYETRAGKIGLAVGADGFCSECVGALAMCGADVIVNVLSPNETFNAALSARAKAFEFGLPVAVISDRLAVLASADGELVLSSADKRAEAEIALDRNYHAVTLRRRGKKHRR